MATIKQEVNWLPCNFKHVNLVFWGSVILGIIAAIFLGWFTQTLNTTFMWIGKCFGLGGAICGAIFTYVFAKGCRSVKSSLYTVFLLMAVTSLLQVIISFPITITNPDPTILIINSLIGLIALVLYIVATVIICSNCTGELGNIGKSMWKVPLIFIGIIVISVLAGLVINDNASESLIIVLGAVGGIWIIYAIFAKILLPMKDLLMDGQLVEELTQNGVDVYSDDERTQIAEMEGYQASEATVYDQPQMTQQKAKGGLGEVWNRLSGTMQGIIVAIIVVLLALAGFGIYSAVKSSGDSHDTYDEDEDFDRIELASPSDEEEVAVEEVVDEAPLEDYTSVSELLPYILSDGRYNASKGQTEYPYYGNFLYNDKEWPISIVFVENDNNPGVISKAIYTNKTSKTVMNLSVKVFPREIDLIGNEKGKEFNIVLTGTAAQVPDVIYGYARWGDMETDVEIYKDKEYN